ncbi:MAG: glycine zipper 2TM domain-containing protein [Rhizobacter sp.]
MTDVVAASHVETPAPRRKLPVWAIAGIVGVLGAVGGGALSTALVKNQATPEPVVAEAPAAPANVAKAAKNHASNKPVVQEDAAECRSCGVVEKVVAVKQKGEGTGVGAVAGGVVGGVLGNQVGGGNGKKAMTVLGAVGGGFAGHEIEKQARATTVYKVHVRMDDGTTRTVTQSTAPAVGARIQL